MQLLYDIFVAAMMAYCVLYVLWKVCAYAKKQIKTKQENEQSRVLAKDVARKNVLEAVEITDRVSEPMYMTNIMTEVRKYSNIDPSCKTKLDDLFKSFMQCRRECLAARRVIPVFREDGLPTEYYTEVSSSYLVLNYFATQVENAAKQIDDLCRQIDLKLEEIDIVLPERQRAFEMIIEQIYGMEAANMEIPKVADEFRKMHSSAQSENPVKTVAYLEHVKYSIKRAGEINEILGDFATRAIQRASSETARRQDEPT